MVSSGTPEYKDTLCFDGVTAPKAGERKCVWRVKMTPICP